MPGPTVTLPLSASVWKTTLPSDPWSDFHTRYRPHPLARGNEVSGRICLASGVGRGVQLGDRASSGAGSCCSTLWSPWLQPPAWKVTPHIPKYRASVISYTVQLYLKPWKGRAVFPKSHIPFEVDPILSPRPQPVYTFSGALRPFSSFWNLRSYGQTLIFWETEASFLGQSLACRPLKSLGLCPGSWLRTGLRWCHLGRPIWRARGEGPLHSWEGFSTRAPSHCSSPSSDRLSETLSFSGKTKEMTKVWRAREMRIA